MSTRIYVIRMLGLALGLSSMPVGVQAQQFYHPSHFNRTRQALTNRTITRRLGRKRRHVPPKPAPKRQTPATSKGKPAPSGRN